MLAWGFGDFKGGENFPWRNYPLRNCPRAKFPPPLYEVQADQDHNWASGAVPPLPPSPLPRPPQTTAPSRSSGRRSGASRSRAPGARPKRRSRRTWSPYRPQSRSPSWGRGVGRDAFEGKGPQRQPQKRLGRRLEEVAKAVGGDCRLQMPLKPLAVRGTVAGHGRPAHAAPPPPSLPMHSWACKGTIVGKHAIYNGGHLVRPFLVHKILGLRPPPPSPQHPLLAEP